MGNKKLEKPSKKRPYSQYFKYSGIAFQMAAIIGLGTFGGVKLDEYFALESPIFTAVLSLTSVIAAMWYALKDFINPKKK